MQTAHDLSDSTYANMGRRVVAFLIDFVIISIPIAALFYFFAIGFGADGGSGSPQTGYPGDLSADLVRDATGTGTVYFLYFMIPFTVISYFSVAECSKAQATFGKMLMGIKVVNQKGQDMTFVNAFMRACAKFFVSGIFFIGYLMAFFDSEHRALHDRWAGTHVVNR